MLSGTWNPRFGDGATSLERGSFVVEMVDDEVKNLWQEGARHGGLRQNR